MLIDSHAHICTQKDTSPEEYCYRAQKSNIEAIIAVGCHPDHLELNIQKSITLQQQGFSVFPTLGIHPDLFQDPDTTEADITTQLTSYKGILNTLYEKYSSHLVALGECGLDYYWPHHRQAQIALFTFHIEKSLAWNLPVIIHIRDAWEDFFEILKQYPNLHGVVHCFSGDHSMATRILSYPNLLLSFSGVVTFPKAQEQYIPVLQNVPLDRFLVETDTPYLTPVPLRGQPNEPAFVAHTAQHIANVRGLSLEELAHATTLNTKRFFKLVY